MQMSVLSASTYEQKHKKSTGLILNFEKPLFLICFGHWKWCQVFLAPVFELASGRKNRILIDAMCL